MEDLPYNMSDLEKMIFAQVYSDIIRGGGSCGWAINQASNAIYGFRVEKDIPELD